MIPEKVLNAHYRELEKVIYDLAQYSAFEQTITYKFPIGSIKIEIKE